MTEPMNPVQVEADIRTVSNAIAESVDDCDKQYRAYLTADHDYDLAYARAYLNHHGPAHEKKYAAELATKDERSGRDTAEAAWRYADRRARALESELRALQSVGASVRAMYFVAGTGVGA